ncbi:hypothetical protein [Pseudomonas aeruginosa]|uniref:hypothetical protein n=1 Tax=Pseudomonas aeruginosa TaxID=287 RepID=UPI00339D4E3C
MQQNENFAKQAEQAEAEAERPEVVARVVHSNPVVLGQCGPLNANDELMTVAQHAASVARWAEMFNRVEQERDAALARVAELEQKSAGSWTVDTSCGRPILMYEGCSVIEDQTAYEVIRMIKWIGELERQEPVATVAKVPGEDWNSLDLHCNLQDIPPGTKLYAAPVAQAQHSLPEGWMLVECGIWTQEQVDEMQKTVARFRNSEFVDNRALAMAVADAGQCKAPEISLAELLAAAPGKEVPQAWLDVQAERRRQVEVEGYHGFRDNHYISYELSKAARAYIEVSWHALSGGLPCKKPESWPWMAGFKWSDGRTMLVKACALALAEIERLDRAAHGKEGV